MEKRKKTAMLAKMLVKKENKIKKRGGGLSCCCIYLRGILRWGSELGEVRGWDRQDVVGVIQQVGNHIGVATLSSFYQHG